MCFSATGSFIAAGVNAAAGAATLHKTKGTKEAVLASFPLFFAIQQAMEGSLWLTLPAHGALQGWTTNGFVFAALVVWPVLVPFTARLLESDGGRRAAAAVFLALGAGFALYALIKIADRPFAARIVGHSIEYSNGEEIGLVASAVYCLCVCVPLLIASQRSLKLLGLCVASGMIVSLLFYYVAFFSVWCFFAAIASGLVFFRAYVELPGQAGRAAL
jgi:hypothetical protein